MSEPSGPIESRTWVKELSARAVTDSPERRIFGYDVESDLASHYRFSDTLYLSLTGELPSERQSRAFEIVLQFASAISIAEAPIHAAALARICGARVGGVFAVGTLSLGESAERLLAQLGEGADLPSEVPEELIAKDERERASVRRLFSVLEQHLEIARPPVDPSRELALVLALRACGLRQSFQLAAALVIARLPSLIGEAGAAAPGSFKTYPLDMPHFEYVESEHSPRERDRE